MIIPQVQNYFHWGEYIFLNELKFNVIGEIPDNFKYNTDKSGFPFETVEKQLGDEEYNLYINDAGIKIEYGSRKALFYSINTLKQLVAKYQDAFRVPKVIIKDYPRFGIRGIIEGFYGKPWSHEDRMSLIRFSGEYKMNAFFYAPKDDPYHRFEWKKPYPDDKFNELKELINICSENYVDFIFSVSPGVNIAYSSDEDFEFLCDKFNSIMDLGIKKAALLLDDISKELKDSRDNDIFDGDFSKAQVYLSNKLYRYLKSKYNDITFIICPTEYSGFEKTHYKEYIGQNLDEDIIVIWTGPEVASGKISSEDAETEFSLYGHNMLLWDNFPTNDSDDSKQLKIGPVRNRDRFLFRKNHTGILSNPMNQAEASKLALLTYADYIWNPEQYLPDYSMQKAFHHFDHENLDLLTILSENCQSLDMCNEFAPEFEKQVQDALKTGEYSGLTRYLNNIYKLYLGIEKFNNKRFVEEIKPWLNKIRLTAELGLCAVDIINGIKRDDIKSLLDQYKKDEYMFGCSAVMDIAQYAILKDMSLEDKLGQLFMIVINKTKPLDHVETIKKHRIGNVLIRGRYGSSTEIKSIMESITEKNDVPMFIAADHEGGDRYILDERFLRMSSAMAVADTGSKGDAFNNAYLQGIELKTLGFNLILSPVLNVLDDENKSLGKRSFGKAVDKNIIEGCIKGYRYSKIHCCAKYFPVFDDDDTKDINEYENLDAQLEAFTTAIKQKVQGILLSNARIAALDDKNPICLSRTVVTDLLKNRFGYKGLVFAEFRNQTDIAAFFKSCLNAGVDIVTLDISPLETSGLIKKIKESVDDNLLFLIDKAAAKILKYKDLVKPNTIDESKLDFYSGLRDEIMEHGLRAKPLKRHNEKGRNI